MIEKQNEPFAGLRLEKIHEIIDFLGSFAKIPAKIPLEKPTTFPLIHLFFTLQKFFCLYFKSNKLLTSLNKDKSAEKHDFFVNLTIFSTRSARSSHDTQSFLLLFRWLVGQWFAHTQDNC